MAKNSDPKFYVGFMNQHGTWMYVPFGLEQSWPTQALAEAECQRIFVLTQIGGPPGAPNTVLAATGGVLVLEVADGGRRITYYRPEPQLRFPPMPGVTGVTIDSAL